MSSIACPCPNRPNRARALPKTNRLVRDERGAVLVIGLFMALSLVGSLWFLIGIGDAIVFHDRGQELADAAAYSSATIHARGMNLIAAVNIIMLMLVTVFIFAKLIADFLFAVGFGLTLLIVPTFGATAEPAGMAYEAGDVVNEFADGYALAIAPWLEGLGIAQAAVGVGIPWVGTVAALDVGEQYDDKGQDFSALAFGGSNIPGFALTGGFSFDGAGGAGTYKNNGSLRGLDATLGLPIAYEKNQSLCARSVKMVLTFFKSVMQQIPVVGWVMSLPFINRVLDAAISGLGLAAMYGHCSGGMWDLYGPKKMASENGAASMQVWGIALSGTLKDDDDRHVMMATGPQMGLGGSMKNEDATYAAQAEFFYDCEEDWKDDGCNGDFMGFGQYKVEHAIYSINWKARVRRMDDPLSSGISLLTERFTNALFGSAFQKFFTTKVPGVSTAASKLQKWLGDRFGTTQGKNVFDTGLKRIFDYGKGLAKDATKGLRSPAGAQGIYH